MITLFGYPLVTIYLYTLIVIGAITVLYVLFSDILDAVFGGIHFINPALILAFITFFSASGYILEKNTSLSSAIIAGMSTAIAFILDSLFNVFVLIPMSKAEESNMYTDESLKGKIGKVLTPIPVDGFGEVVIEGSLGVISRAAKSEDNKEILANAKVIVKEAKPGLFVVAVAEEKHLDMKLEEK
ncbi:hypothetical protein [Bacillus sp. Brlt_9]|uniref:hypothetical protein n=1 Tax=Bacillus sp. Brlt_9 TaxID=3110916 RepID=UPI003F7B6443